MKILIGILVILSLTGTIKAHDFVEAQMKYKVLENGKKDFQIDWNEEKQFLKLTLGLDWDYYEAPLHKQGYILTKAAEVSAINPMDSEVCAFTKGYGEIAGATDLNKNQVFLEFAGPGCLDHIINFYYAGVAIMFYDVPAYDGIGESTGAFRLQLFDAAR